MGGEFTWSAEAFKILQDAKAPDRFEVKKEIEKYARLNAIKEINGSTLFQARPDPNRLFSRCSDFAFEPHSGPVYSLAFSPFHRSLFLSASSDSSLRLYNILKTKPIMSLQPSSTYLFDACWSPTRPAVFAAASADGRLHIFDLSQSRVGSVLSVPVTEQNAAAHAISFNSKDGSLVAVADSLGRVSVWQLSPRLASMHENERAVLERIGAVADDNE
eukprot:TRINITY_DN9028_c0_g1_i5.p1 TRINITY_DN9028_c0_g1~~TRINITY_DN9028_c0_g1_i5.p1  ORF type:complete len:227 (+),score=21.49 TRINITY_DN9028_c0_g1_i5:31-681(+)